MVKAPEREVVYVSCGLTGLPQEFVEAIKRVIDIIESRGHRMLRWTIINSSWTPAQIYRHDKQCASDCSVMLMICDERSTGMGMEFAFAIMRQIPILCVARHGALITPMVLGACEVEPNVSMIRYGEVAEIPDIFNTFLLAVQRGRKQAVLAA